MNAQIGVMEAFGVLCDRIDATVEAAFPNDLDSEWRNASRYSLGKVKPWQVEAWRIGYVEGKYIRLA